MNHSLYIGMCKKQNKKKNKDMGQNVLQKKSEGALHWILTLKHTYGIVLTSL